MARSCLSLPLAAAIVVLVATGAHADLKIVAAGGDSPPRATGGFAEGLGVPALSDNGQAAFPSNLRQDGFISGYGIFRADGTAGSLATIMLKGDPTPDVNGNIGQADQALININDQDEIAVEVGLTDTLGGGLDNAAIYRTDGSGDLTQIAHLNETVPGNDGKLASFSKIDFNDEGQVAFVSALRDTTDAGAIYRGDGGALSEIVRLKRPAPGSKLTFTVLDIQRIGLNASGHVFFSGSGTDEEANSMQGLFRGDGSTTLSIARQGETAPDGNGTYLLLSSALATFNDAGQAAFTTLMLNTTLGAVDNEAIFRGDGAVMVKIARKGDFVPGNNGRYLDLLQTPIVNNQGQVLFRSTISGASGGSGDGVFLGDGVTAKAVARINENAPGGGRFSGFGSYALNDAGQAAFYAIIDLQDGGAVNDTFGLFLYDPDRGLLAVARKGDQLGELGAIGSINFAGASSAPTPVRDGLNEQGQVAFQCFAGEDVAVVVWTPPQPPPCAQPVTSGEKPSVSDCLFILRAAIDAVTCSEPCVCDVNGNGDIAASDALLCLKKSVGQVVALNCKC